MQFWEELKDRKLVQWTLAYIAVGIAVLEIVNAVEGPFGLSNALVRVIMVGVAVGFVLTIVLAWFHGERGHQRPSVLEIVVLLMVFGAGLVGATIAGRTRSTDVAGGTASTRQPSTAASGWTAPPSAPERNSVAVLPFTNLSGGQQDDYFSDGITEELTNTLGELQGLRVAARTSAFQFKGQRLDLREVGRRLGVANVLEGSVQRSGTRVRILARLVDATTGYKVWAGQVETDASDIFGAEDKISRQVAEALQVKLALARVPTENAQAADPLAHQTYLKAKALSKQQQPGAMQQAQEQYREVVRRDPNWAQGWAGLAQSFVDMGKMGFLPPRAARDSARRAAYHALRRDSTLPEAHMVLAKTASDLDSRAHELRRALDLNPNNAEARAELGEVLAAQGQTRAALEQAREAMRIDPIGSHGPPAFRRIMYMAGHPGDAPGMPTPPVPPEAGVAIPEIARPGAIQATLCADWAADPATARMAPKVCEDALRQAGSDREVLARVALGYARLGRRDEARQALQQYERVAGDDVQRGVRLAAVYAALGDTDAAFAALNRQDPAGLRAALRDPGLLAPLRQDPRFAELERRVAGS